VEFKISSESETDTKMQIINKKHLKNVGRIRHCELPHAALPFTRRRYYRVAGRLRIDVYNDDDDDDA